MFRTIFCTGKYSCQLIELISSCIIIIQITESHHNCFIHIVPQNTFCLFSLPQFHHKGCREYRRVSSLRTGNYYANAHSNCSEIIRNLHHLLGSRTRSTRKTLEVSWYRIYICVCACVIVSIMSVYIVYCKCSIV